MPFFAEEMYFNLKTEDMPESIHLCSWPELKEDSQTDLELEEEMDETRSLVNLILAERSQKNIKVRQPIASVKVKNKNLKIKNKEEFLELIKEETNIKKIIFDSKIKKDLELDTKITEELKEEGFIREITRHIQDMRKKTGLNPADEILVFFACEKNISEILEKNKKIIQKEIKIKDFYFSQKINMDNVLQKEIIADNKKILLAIKKI